MHVYKESWEPSVGDLVTFGSTSVSYAAESYPYGQQESYQADEANVIHNGATLIFIANCLSYEQGTKKVIQASNKDEEGDITIEYHYNDGELEEWRGIRRQRISSEN